MSKFRIPRKKKKQLKKQLAGQLKNLGNMDWLSWMSIKYRNRGEFRMEIAEVTGDLDPNTQRMVDQMKESEETMRNISGIPANKLGKE